MSNVLKQGAAKLRVVSSTDDMLAQIVKDGRKLVDELVHELERSESKLKNVQHMLDTHQKAVDANKEFLIETRRHNLLHYAFTANTEVNETVGDCITWLKKHPEVYEAFTEKPE